MSHQSDALTGQAPKHLGSRLELEAENAELRRQLTSARGRNQRLVQAVIALGGEHHPALRWQGEGETPRQTHEVGSGATIESAPMPGVGQHATRLTGARGTHDGR